MNVLDLFSGIGGFSLGLERAGFKTVAFCEIDPFCQSVLRKHWPDVPCYGDIRELTAGKLPEGIDVICGGFPCQDISVAGKGAGIEGSRSGLWKEYARIIGELRPRYVIVENVAALLNRGLERVLGDLAALGYDAEWHCIPASAVGAPHRRDRVWIVAHPERRTIGAGLRQNESTELRRGRFGDCGSEIPDSGRSGSSGSWQPIIAGHPAAATIGQAIKLIDGCIFDQWLTEPDVGRVAHGVPARVDRLRALGNAVVPQIPEIIGRAIMDAEHGLA